MIPQFFIRGFSTNKPFILRINMLVGSCNIPHPPFTCLNERAQYKFFIEPPSNNLCPVSLFLQFVLFFHFTSCHALIASPRACKRACTRLKGKKDNKLQKERRDTTKGKEGSIKNTNSYTPSKVVNEWHNIPLFSFLKLIVEVKI